MSSRALLGATALQSAALFLACGQAAADTVYLGDGSRLNGTVSRLTAEELLIETSFAGELRIDRSAVSGIDTDNPVQISLPTGEHLIGRLDYSPERGQYVYSEAAGKVSLQETRIAEMWSSDAPSPALAAAEEELKTLKEEHEATVESLEAKIKDGDDVWSGSLEAGLSGAAGGSDRFNFLGRGEALRETEFDRLSMFLEGRYATEEGVSTENEVLAGGRLERDFSRRWFAFGNVDLERDEFEDLDLRAILTAGVGRFLIRKETQTLKVRLGVGYQVEAFKNDANENSGILSVGYDYRIDVSDWLRFTHELTLFPNLSDPTGEFRLNSAAGLEIPLRGESPWSVRLRVRNQYDADPEPGIAKLDTTYSVSLGYDFE